MVFTDLTFLFGFLPVVWLLYRLVAKTKLVNFYLLIASLLFYGWGGLRSLAILILALMWNYLAAGRIGLEEDPEKRKKVLFLAVGVNLAVLFFYRYLGVWFGGLSGQLANLPKLMPVGLSFYLFSCLSCLFDVASNRCQAPSSLINFGVYAAFFGRVNMGPIGHYARFEEQLTSHPVTRAKSAQGMSLFLQGMLRKVILADNFALLYGTLNGNTTWLGNLLLGFAYFFQLYFDFSGYSRMARGLALLFGFQIDPNFNLPYTATSVQDFWRRRHISLTDWFRDYVYIPLGGNRVSVNRWRINILCVWLLTGLWHGATLPFIVWGLFQGGLILLEREYLNAGLKKLPAIISHLYLILTQLIGWTFFSSPSLTLALTRIGRYFAIGISGFADYAATFELFGNLGLFFLAILLSSGLSVLLAQMFKKQLKGKWQFWNTLGWIGVFIVCVSFLVSATARTFLYAAF